MVDDLKEPPDAEDHQEDKGSVEESRRQEGKVPQERQQVEGPCIIHGHCPQIGICGSV
jgi:hypothetical protein